MKWACGVFIVMWLVFLTIISTDLNYKYNESEKRNDEMIIMIREYKEEIEKRDNRLEEIINQNNEKITHDMIVHDQMITAQIKGIMKEW